jgi:hypothetical protein
MHCGAVFTNTPEYQQGANWGCAAVVVVIGLSLLLWALGWEPYGY